jgi:hypothetical protein
MPRFLPDRSRRRGERRIGECTESDANMVGSPIQVPIDRSAAFWTETEPDLPPLLDLPNVDLAGSFGSNLGLLEIDADAEGCACASLTFEAVTRDDGAGFALYLLEPWAQNRTRPDVDAATIGIPTAICRGRLAGDVVCSERVGVGGEQRCDL